MSRNASTFSSIRALWSTLFGVGMYFTPRAFAESGILYGCFQLFFVGIISMLSIYFLFFFSFKEIGKKQQTVKKVKESVPLNTYSINLQEEQKEIEVNEINLSYAKLGKVLKKWIGGLIDGLICVSNISTVLFFQKYVSLISSSLMPQSVIEVLPFDAYYGFIIIYGAVIWLGGQYKKLQSIDWLSLISFGFILTNCTIVGIMTCLLGDYKATHVPNPGNSMSFSTISAFLFAMDCQANVVEVFSEMENKKISNLAIVSFSAAFGACIFYGLMGITGSLLFGDNMPKKDIISILANRKSSIVQFLLSSNSIFYWVHYIVPCLAIIGLLISSVYQLSAVTRSLNEKKTFKKIINLDIRQKVTTGVVITLVSIINMFPGISLDIVFDFISYFMSNFLGYLFPFIFIAYLYWGEKWHYVVPCVIMSICSVCFGVYGFVDSIIANFFPQKNLTQEIILANGISKGLKSLIKGD